jgi:queuine/archaeosine tRNA-ribosyltransferase
MNTPQYTYIPACSVGAYGIACASNKRFLNDLPLRYYTTEMDARLYHPWFLATAGHFYKKENYRELLGADESSIILGDSGGFQIATGAIAFDEKLLHTIFQWLEENSTIAMNLDIPPRMQMKGKFDECLEMSYKNYKYFEKNQTGKTKYLNVLHGYDISSFKKWYDKVKGMEFQGWAVGNVSYFKQVITALAVLLDGNEHKKTNNLYLHFLGCSKLSDFFIFTSLQNELNKIGCNIQILSDSSSPTNMMRFGGFAHQPNFRNETIDNLHIPHRLTFEEKMSNEYKMPKLIPADYYIENCYELSDFQECNQRFNCALSLHNISIYLDAAATVSELVKHPYILEQTVKSATHDAINLIRTMIANLENGNSAESYIIKNNMLIDIISSKLTTVDLNTEHEFF